MAFGHFAKATELDPNDTAAGLNTATVLLQAGVYDRAEKHFRAVLAVEPDCRRPSSAWPRRCAGKAAAKARPYPGGRGAAARRSCSHAARTGRRRTI